MHDALDDEFAADQRPDPPAAIRWECQVGHVDEEGDLVIFDVTIETPDVREAIRRCSEDFPSDDIEWVKVRRG